MGVLRIIIVIRYNCLIIMFQIPILVKVLDLYSFPLLDY